MAKERKLKEEQISSTTLPMPKVQELNAMINSLKNTNVGVESIINLIKLKSELKGILTEQNEAISELFGKKYNLPLTTTETGQQVYTYKGHENEKEIAQEQEALLSREVVIKSTLNFMQMKEIVSAAEGLPMGVLADLAEYLAVK